MDRLEASTLIGSKVIAAGSDAGIPFLNFSNGLGALVLCDPEGNGPGFLFGLPHPDQAEMKKRQEKLPAGNDNERLCQAWDELYYESAVGATVTAVGMNAPDKNDPYGESFPYLRMTIPLGKETITAELEISRDQEGNGPGYLLVSKI